MSRISKKLIAKYLKEDVSEGMNTLIAYLSAVEGYLVLNNGSGGSQYYGWFTFTVSEYIDNKMLVERANAYLNSKGVKSVKVTDICDL